MPMFKKAAPLFLLLIALLLTSCWDAFDPGEMLHVWAIGGVDRGGLADKWRLTLLFFLRRIDGRRRRRGSIPPGAFFERRYHRH